jgi:hypothetical protein
VPDYGTYFQEEKVSIKFEMISGIPGDNEKAVAKGFERALEKIIEIHLERPRYDILVRFGSSDIRTLEHHLDWDTETHLVKINGLDKMVAQGFRAPLATLRLIEPHLMRGFNSDAESENGGAAIAWLIACAVGYCLSEENPHGIPYRWNGRGQIKWGHCRQWITAVEKTYGVFSTADADRMMEDVKSGIEVEIDSPMAGMMAAEAVF